ncbi:aminopeptidase [Legionella donaldsonii]|uniref:Aminopeptidase n=1 Tax=Legionella donaldsonii TaxID=45060 RepID=A0A378IYC4_9GAMM|nr:M20/M25/M40 family metallo-hydrolase [Legionella donaldsonii]STX40474.1 aminopeptidase [Legionella donaldsonii]
MRFYSRMIFLIVVFIFSANPLFAEAKPVLEQLQIPQCLAAKLSAEFSILAQNRHFKIIELHTKELDKLALLADEAHCGRFVNVSHYFVNSKATDKQKISRQLLAKPPVFKTAFLSSPPYKINQERKVNDALARIDADHIIQVVSHLSNYYNRSASGDSGVQTAKWLQTQFDGLVHAYGRSDTKSYFVKTGNYIQPSLVTVIGKDIHAPAIVLGAHMDTLDGFMPGAGDDASGSASLMEVARVLLASSLTFERPIYLIWYAAEERGLVGSQYVVRKFLRKKIPVKAVIQFDMTGFRNDANDPTMWVFRDYTDKMLSDYIAELIKTYIKVPVAYSRCGYGCSDHASWMSAGIPAAFPCETSFERHNPYIHSAADTMDLLNTDHMVNFTKLGLAFAIELASD